MPVTPTPQNPRGYGDVRQNDVNMPNAVNSIKNEISRDIEALEEQVSAQQSNGRRLALHNINTTDTTLELSGNTWTRLGAILNFEVMNATSNLEFTVAGALSLRRPSTNTNGDCGSRLLIDAGTAKEKILRIGGSYKDESTNGNTYSNPLSGSSIVVAQGLTVGNHTLQLQIWHAENGTLLFQPTAFPNSYFAEINAWECG